MLFNSFAFALFFPLVTAGYFLLPHRWRWFWLLAASCYFYTYFIPIYFLILASTIVIDYFAGRLIEGSSGAQRKGWLIMSIVANVGVLAAFKYFNFINHNLEALAQLIGWNYPIKYLSIALPVGLSFHTFQAMSYTIEVYRGKQKAERHFGIYALYVMFYPQLVAGPIERPQNLLHQFHARHYFDYDRVASGLRLMAWGLFKKMVVADRLARIVNLIYATPGQFSGPPLTIATVFFAFQIFCDFSGYSDIAIGSARVMGFKLMTNFDRPYHAQSIAEFWRRWHISLSTWFRDYLYIPLGGNRVSPARWCANMFVVFLVSGLWHGANWTYVIWGALHGGFLVFGAVTAKFRARLAEGCGLRQFPSAHTVLRVLATFTLVNLGWIFFRASSVHDAWLILTRLATGWTDLGGVAGLRHLAIDLQSPLPDIALCFAAILTVEGVHCLQQFRPEKLHITTWPWWLRWSTYYAVICSLLLLASSGTGQFIYFQF